MTLTLVSHKLCPSGQRAVIALTEKGVLFERRDVGLLCTSFPLAAAQRILAEVRPDILALNAGTPPRMGRLVQLSWADFTATWETDVKAGLYWLQAALNLPLKPGSRVLVGSSGAAVTGSPLTGGYAGAKRGTGVGDAGANAYARAAVRLAPAWLDGREVIAVYEDPRR